MMNDIKNMFEHLIINSKPVYYIEDCLTALGTQYPQTETDDTDNEEEIETKEDIAESFRTCVYLCNEEELAFLNFAVEMTEKKVAWEENVEYYPFSAFAFNNFAYLFSYGEGLYLVLPAELIDIYRQVTSEENFSQVNARNRALSDYATALCNLYGAYEMEQFANVWNQHRKDKITVSEAEKFLADRAGFESEYYILDSFVVHACLFYDDFYELFDDIYDMDYYMPTKSVIKAYADKDALKTAEHKEMEAFLKEFIEDESALEDLFFEIGYSCERLLSPEEVRSILEEAGAPLDSAAFCKRFEQLFNSLRLNTHVWELGGFTPHQYQAATGKSIPRFALPKK